MHFYIPLHATLKETFPAMYDYILPKTPQARPGSEICTLSFLYVAPRGS